MKVTVAIPTYNNLKDLKKALDSVFMQDYDDYEIVISDNSTNYETEQYIQELNNEKIRYFHNIPSISPSANWNNMIEKSQGEYVKILFDDDWFLTKDALRKCVEMMDNNPDADFGYCKQIGFKRGTNKIVHRRAQKYVKRLKKDPMELFLSNRISAPSVIIIKQKCSIRFDKNLIWGNDTDYYIKLILSNNNFAFLNEELIALGCPTTQLTQTFEKKYEIVTNDILRIYNRFEKEVLKSKYKNKIQKKIIKQLKDFQINTLEELNEILKETTIPEFIINYYKNNKKSLFEKFIQKLNLSK